MLYDNIIRYMRRGTMAVMALLLASSCTDDFVQESVSSQKAMNLQAEIQQNNVTRANDNGFADGDQIGVFVVNYENEAASPTLQLTGNHADNVRFTYDDNEYKWTGSYQLYWKDNKTPIDVYGYYPFISQLTSITEQPFTIQRDQREPDRGGMSGYEQSDFLWAKAESIAPTDAAIILKHRHIMAGIQVTLAEGTGFAQGEWADAEKSVLVQNVAMTGTINLCTGVTSPNPSQGGESLIPQEAQGKYRAVIYPQNVEAGTPLFAITIDGKAMKFTRNEAMEYVAHKLHMFTIEVNKDSSTGQYTLSLLSDAIVDWENDPLSHNGTAREYITVHVNEGEYLSDVLKRMGIEDPSEIRNLKLTGCISRFEDFQYIRENIPYLEAINMKDLRTKHMPMADPWEEDRENEYGRPAFADDVLPSGGYYDSAFERMEYLQYVVWPDHLKGIGDECFAGASLRGSLIFPEGLKWIGGCAFDAYGHKNNNLTGEIYIPSTVEYIGGGAFGCFSDSHWVNNTGEVILPPRMKYLGPDVFTGCRYMTGTIQIPDGITELYRFAAPNMTGDVIIPQGVKRVYGIGGKPSSIYFPEGVEYIGALSGANHDGGIWGTPNNAESSLHYIRGDMHLPSTVKKIEGGAFMGASFSHINLPEGLEIIEPCTFRDCRYLTDTLTIPASVTRIKDGAFAGCQNLSAIILPEKLEMIHCGALDGCWSLDYIQCNAKEPPLIEGGSFYGLEGLEKNNFTLVVPEGSVDAYRNAPGWNEFKRISAYRNFVCRPMIGRLLNKSNTRTVVLNADGNWKMTHCPSWVHVDKTSGYKKTELSIKIDAMAHGSANRADSVVFTLTDKKDEDGHDITCYYKVEQYDYEHEEDSQLQLQKHTKGKGVNLVFIGDGYDAVDISTEQYLADIKEGMEYFFAVEPYKTYQDYFDVYIDFPLSYDSGVCSNVNIWRTTKFDTTYGAGNGGRLKVNFDDMMSYVLDDVTGTVVNGSNVNQTLIVTVLNSDVYEGLTSMWSSGAAIAAVPHSRYDYPNDYRGLIQHEAGGHGFGKLDDEYIYHRENIRSCPCFCCSHVEDVEWAKGIGWSRNVSLNGRYKEIDWTHLIFDDRYQDIVDIYEGSHMHAQGIYRSEVNSCMNNNVPYFSTISRQAIVERIMDYSGGKFDFETFVSKDSREMGDKFLTRGTLSTSGESVGGCLHGNMPQIVKGSPLKNMNRKVKYNSKKQAR